MANSATSIANASVPPIPTPMIDCLISLVDSNKNPLREAARSTPVIDFLIWFGDCV